MPNTLQGVLLFRIFSRVRAPMALFFCPSGEQHPTTSHPCQRENSRLVCLLFQTPRKRIWGSCVKIMKRWITVTKFYQPGLKINGACSEFDWRQKVIQKQFENWAREKKNSLFSASAKISPGFFLPSLSKPYLFPPLEIPQAWESNGGGRRLVLRNQKYFKPYSFCKNFLGSGVAQTCGWILDLPHNNRAPQAILLISLHLSFPASKRRIRFQRVKMRIQ